MHVKTHKKILNFLFRHIAKHFSLHTLSHNTMASLIHSNLVSLFCHIFLLLIISYPPNILSQDPTSSSPTIAPCTSSLLPLFPCMPFVQGAVNTPAAGCCSNLKQLYSQEPRCLCFLFNNTTFTSFPINRTLALQIPTLCNLHVDNSVCQGHIINHIYY